MKDLELTPEELRVLNEPCNEGNPPCFFLEYLASSEYLIRRLAWDNILDSAECSEALVQKINELLPSAPVGRKEHWAFGMYNCYDAAFYAMGVEPKEHYVPRKEKSVDCNIVIPPSVPVFDYENLGRHSFQQVTEPKGGDLITLYGYDCKRQRKFMFHAAVFIGKSDNISYVFHKPGKLLPEIRGMPAVIGGFCIGNEECFDRKEEEIKIEYWEHRNL
jgi:hypothetical protein